MYNKIIKSKKLRLNSVKIGFVIASIVITIIVSGCSSIVCEEPAIINQEMRTCCDDINKNHVCDEKEQNLTWPAGKIVDPYHKLPSNIVKEPKSEEVNDITNIKTSLPLINRTKNKIASIKTNKGEIKFELFEDKAPVTSKNFIELANAGFYNGLKFHRYVPGFVIQGGDPKGDGTGSSGKTIKLEINNELKHIKGAVAMARSQDPDSASSQFYITLAETPNLDGQYAVFGKVIEGMDVVMQLRQGDVMKDVSVE